MISSRAGYLALVLGQITDIRQRQDTECVIWQIKDSLPDTRYPVRPDAGYKRLVILSINNFDRPCFFIVCKSTYPEVETNKCCVFSFSAQAELQLRLALTAPLERTKENTQYLLVSTSDLLIQWNFVLSYIIKSVFLRLFPNFLKFYHQVKGGSGLRVSP